MRIKNKAEPRVNSTHKITLLMQEPVNWWPKEKKKKKGNKNPELLRWKIYSVV